jgi:hypothetical protein
MAGGKDHAANKQGRVAAGNAQGGNESNRAVKRPKKKVVPSLGGVVPATSEHASSAGRPVTAPLTGLSQPGAGIHLPHLPAHMDPSSTLQHYMAHMGSQHDPAMAAMVFRAMPFGGAGSSQRHSGTYLIGGSGPSPYAGAPLLPQMQNHGMAARPGGMGGLAAIEMSELASKRWRTVIKALNCLRLSDEASKAVQEALRVELNHGPHSDSDDEVQLIPVAADSRCLGCALVLRRRPHSAANETDRDERARWHVQREFVADLIEKAICEVQLNAQKNEVFPAGSGRPDMKP